MEQDTTAGAADGTGFQCAVCGAEFESESALETHVRRVGLLE